MIKSSELNKNKSYYLALANTRDFNDDYIEKWVLYNYEDRSILRLTEEQYKLLKTDNNVIIFNADAEFDIGKRKLFHYGASKDSYDMTIKSIPTQRLIVGSRNKIILEESDTGILVLEISASKSAAPYTPDTQISTDFDVTLYSKQSFRVEAKYIEFTVDRRDQAYNSAGALIMPKGIAVEKDGISCEISNVIAKSITIPMGIINVSVVSDYSIDELNAINNCKNLSIRRIRNCKIGVLSTEGVHSLTIYGSIIGELKVAESIKILDCTGRGSTKDIKEVTGKFKICYLYKNEISKLNCAGTMDFSESILENKITINECSINKLILPKTVKEIKMTGEFCRINTLECYGDIENISTESADKNLGCTIVFRVRPSEKVLEYVKKLDYIVDIRRNAPKVSDKVENEIEQWINKESVVSRIKKFIGGA